MAEFNWNGPNVEELREEARIVRNSKAYSYAKRKSAERRASGIYDKTCVHCGKSYHAFKHDQKFCSDECRIAHRPINRSNRWVWSQNIKSVEGVSFGYQAHHILPVASFPDDALEAWNGVPLPDEWHREFHSLTGGARKSNDPFFDWVGVLFEFIEHKIQMSKINVNTLVQWF